MTATMGPKQLRDPVVKALGDLSGMKPNVAVDHKSVYDAICKAMGVTIDHYGHQPGSGSPWIERWTQWAFKDLTQTTPPLTVSMGKGKWALTVHGVAKAQSLGGGVMVTAPVVSPVSTGGVYETDPYLRSLAVQETKCFNYFSDQAPTCMNCPLREGCRHARMSALSELARKLAFEDEALKKAMEDKAAAEARAKAAEAAAAEAANLKAQSSSTSSASPPASGAKITGAQIITCAQDALCRDCGKKMAKGSDIVWVRGAGGKAGLMHIECYDVLVKNGEASPLTKK